MKMVLVAVLLPLSCLLAWSQQLSLAVIRIEPIAVEAETARLTEESLQREFAKLPQFQLADRGGLEETLRSQGLQLSKVNDAESAARAGSALNVQKVIFGTIGRYESAYVQFVLSLRVVDVERAAVEAAESIQIRSKADIQNVAGVVVNRLSGRIQPVGKITRVDAGAIYVGLGEGWGIAPAELLSVARVELTKDAAGKILLREEKALANLVVEKVSPEGSLCRVQEKAAELQVGMSVRRGAATIQQETKCGLAVDSVPDNAKVFWDDVLLGVTPLRSSDLTPGKHRLEIRYAAGFKPYAAQVNLKPGQTLAISRELEREADLEEVLLLGKVPRKHTDPKTALLWALIPGGGAYYNGFPLQTVTVVGAMAQLPMYPEMNASYIDFLKQDISRYSGSTTYYDSYYYHRDVQTLRGQVLLLGLLMSGPVVNYLGSILDAWIDSRADFAYPAYMGISTGGSYGLAHQAQSTDNHSSDINPSYLSAATGGYGNQYPGYFFEFYFEAVRHRADLEIEYIFQQGIYINPCYYYRFLVADWWQLGVGTRTQIAVSYGGYLTEGDFIAFYPLMLINPSLMFSSRLGRLEMDFSASPYGVLNLTVPTVTNLMGAAQTTMQVIGPWGKADLRYFFSSRFGIRLIVEGALLWTLDRDLIDAGFSTVANYQMLKARLGVVFRW